MGGLLEQCLLYWKQVIPQWMIQTPNGSRTDQSVSETIMRRETMKFFQTILVIASLALCMGCDVDPTGSQDSSSVQTDGGSKDGGNIGSDNGQGDSSTDAEIQWNKQTKLTIIVKTPDGLPADLYVCGGGSCYSGDAKPFVDPPNGFVKKVEGAEEIEFVQNDFGFTEVTFYAVRKNYLFYYLNVHYVNGDKKEDTVNTTWTEPGSWGLAPNGTYIDSFDGGKQTSITTSVKNGKVTLTYNNSGGIVTHDAFLPDDQNPNKKIAGQISNDLSQLQLKATFPNLPEKNFETTLTVVK